MTLPAVDVATEFRALAARWHAETDDLSSALRAVSHAAYLRIIGLGEPAISLILHDLSENGGLWFPALEAITGASLGSDTERKSYAITRDFWLLWGREHGYL